MPSMSHIIRFGVLALALLGVGAALARPICDLERSALNVPAHEDCCTSLADAMLPVPPSAAVAFTKLPKPAPMAPAWQEPTPRFVVAAIPADRLPLTRLYHARSARILS